MVCPVSGHLPMLLTIFIQPVSSVDLFDLSTIFFLTSNSSYFTSYLSLYFACLPHKPHFPAQFRKVCVCFSPWRRCFVCSWFRSNHVAARKECVMPFSDKEDDVPHEESKDREARIEIFIERHFFLYIWWFCDSLKVYFIKDFARQPLVEDQHLSSPHLIELWLLSWHCLVPLEFWRTELWEYPSLKPQPPSLLTSSSFAISQNIHSTIKENGKTHKEGRNHRKVRNPIWFDIA